MQYWPCSLSFVLHKIKKLKMCLWVYSIQLKLQLCVSLDYKLYLQIEVTVNESRESWWALIGNNCSVEKTQQIPSFKDLSDFLLVPASRCSSLDQSMTGASD